MMTDLGLIIGCICALATIVVLISVTKLPPFLAILAGALVAGAGAQLPLRVMAKDFAIGAGHLFGDAGLIIALGAMLGALMADSGAADHLASALLSRVSGRYLPWAVALVAMLVGLPLFFEVGLVLLAPMIYVMARRAPGSPVLIAVPALAGLTTLHALVPPHPGPLIAITTLHADLGVTMLFGLAIALPVVILAGPLYAYVLAPRLHIELPASMQTLFASTREEAQRPSVTASLLVILLPVGLMLGRSLAELELAHSNPAFSVLDALGQPMIALAITVAVAIVVFGWAKGSPRAQVGKVLQSSLAPIASLLLTIAAGGGLKQILLHGGVGDQLSGWAQHAHMPVILLAWLVAVLLRQAIGSATVATATAAGILAPAMAGLSPAHGALLALAIGTGSVFFCHVNDAGFWMVREYFGLTLKQTLWLWSVLQTIVSVAGLLLTSIGWILFA